jgi:hypothetical protein
VSAPGPARLVLALRMFLVIAAAGAAIAAAITSVRAPARAAVFACPMHAEVREPVPGGCPICGMALERVGARPASPATAAAPDTTAVENVRKHRTLDFVRKRALLAPVRELRGPAWVEADGAVAAVLYDDQIAALAADEAATFSPSAAAPTAAPALAPAVALRRAEAAPARWDASTSLLRFRAAGPAARRALRANDVGWLVLPPKARDVLAVPSAALVPSPDGYYVLVADGAGGYERRDVRIGETFVKQGFAVVLAGLREHERVAARATFFLDADRKLAASRGEGMP